MFTSRHVMAAAVAVSLLAGCEIVTSETYKTEGKIPSGFTYFLPKNMMKIEASTIKASTENVAKAKSAIAKLKTAATEAATAADATKTAQSAAQKEFDAAKKNSETKADKLKELDKASQAATVVYLKAKQLAEDAKATAAEADGIFNRLVTSPPIAA